MSEQEPPISVVVVAWVVAVAVSSVIAWAAWQLVKAVLS